MTLLQAILRRLARELADPAAAAAAPTTIDQLRHTVERVDGVRFGALLEALQPDAGCQQGALDDILHTARTMPADQATGPVSYTHLRAHETDSYLVCRL